MFGPVTSHSREFSDSVQSLATKRSPRLASASSTTGCRPPSISKQACSTSAGRAQPPSTARSASAAETSSRASASAVAAMASRLSSAAAVRSSRCAASAASACAPACATFSATSCRSGALKRTTPASVWRCVKPLSGFISASAFLRRHLDMIAEHAVVPDLERGDAGARAVVRLQRGDRAPPARAGVAQIVERGVIAFGDIAALRSHRSAARGPARGSAGRSARRGRAVAARVRRAAAGGVAIRSSRSPSRHAPSSPSRNCPRSRGLPRPAASRPSARPISAQPAQRRAQRCRASALSSTQQLHQIEPRLDRARVHQRRADIGGEQPRARARHGAVDRVEQAALALPARASASVPGSRASPRRSPSPARACCSRGGRRNGSAPLAV